MKDGRLNASERPVAVVVKKSASVARVAITSLIFMVVWQEPKVLYVRASVGVFSRSSHPGNLS